MQTGQTYEEYIEWLTNEYATKVWRTKKMARINDGDLIAHVRATSKNKTMHKNHSGREMGGLGKDGRKFYEIRKQGAGRYTCSCPAYRFSTGEVGKKKPCKHLKKLFHDFKNSCVDASEILLSTDTI